MDACTLQSLMRSPLLRCQAPTPPCGAVGFFGSGCPPTYAFRLTLRIVHLPSEAFALMAIAKTQARPLEIDIRKVRRRVQAGELEDEHSLFRSGDQFELRRKRLQYEWNA